MLKKVYPVKTYFLIVVSLLIIIGTIVTTIFMLRHEDYLRHLQSYGYVGLFLVALIAGSPLPVPSFCSLLTFTLGSILNPILVGLLAAFGVSSGRMLIYLSAQGGYQLLEISKIPHPIRRIFSKIGGGLQRKAKVLKILNFLDRHAIASVFLISLIPNPFLMPTLLTLGARQTSLWRVFLACFMGKMIYYILLAFLGLFDLHYLI